MMDQPADKTNRDGAGAAKPDRQSPAPDDSSGDSYYYDDSTGYEVFEDDEEDSEEAAGFRRDRLSASP